MNAAHDGSRKRIVLAVLDLHFVVRRNGLIKPEQLDVRVMANWRRVGILDKNLLTDSREYNVWIERAEMIIQHDGLFELRRVVWMDIDLFAQLRPKEDDHVHKRIILADNQ